MKRLLICGLVGLTLFMTSCSGGGGSNGGSDINPPPVITSSYTLLAWSELGMHCMDGKDYSVFGVLPPFNTIRAQLVKRGDRPQLVTSGVTVTYEAVADLSGSVNTSSSNKTNFWDYAGALFLTALSADVGLAGKAVQSRTPQQMDFNTDLGVWWAEGIPTVPYDDTGLRNAYPMAKLVAKDSQGNVLAETKIVLPVSDELSCSTCHASNANPAAEPLSGWENNPDPAKDVKFNILKLHDEKNNISAFLAALAGKGYQYQASLHDTAQSGTSILCAACHGSNALPGTGLTGIPPLTQSMHTLHGSVTTPGSTTTLDNATSPFGSCYLCHPGIQTKCQRGAMSSITCQNCHGNLSNVGSAQRRGWLDLPRCQNCHNNSQRYQTAFDTSGQWRTTSDLTFATNPDTPLSGVSLYRFSHGHGSVGCPACHNSPHAEFPTSQPNDNVYSLAIQGYGGTLTECTVCHTSAPLTASGAAHGMHTVGQTWVDRHKDYAGGGQYAQCAYCHGTDYLGSALSATKTSRSFTVEDRTKSFTSGQIIGCYDCHNGPTGG